MLYRSMATVPISPRALEILVRQSARANAKSNITGQLLYAQGVGRSSGMFAHWIEGAADAVQALYHERIAKDPRHTHFEVLYDGPIETVTGRNARRFAEWSLHGETTDLGAFPISTQEFIRRAPLHDGRPRGRSLSASGV